MSSTRDPDGTWSDDGSDERTQVIDVRPQVLERAEPTGVRPPVYERDIARTDPRGTPDWDLQVSRMSNRPLTDAGLLVLRLCSLPLVLHGFYHLGSFGGLVDSLRGGVGGVPPEAIAVGLVVGQLLLPPLLAVGFLTRVSALTQAGMMSVAYALLVLSGAGILDPATGALAGESVLAYAALALPLLFTGAGRFSIDHAVGASGRERRVERRVAKRLSA